MGIQMLVPLSTSPPVMLVVMVTMSTMREDASFGHLPKDAQEVLAQQLPDLLLIVTPPEQGFRHLGEPGGVFEAL